MIMTNHSRAALREAGLRADAAGDIRRKLKRFMKTVKLTKIRSL